MAGTLADVLEGVSRAAGGANGALRAASVGLKHAETLMKTCIIGLDCVPPRLLDFPVGEHLPNLRRLAREGGLRPFKSTVPPITIPAWVSMTSGRDPGALGLYGFRERVPNSYAHRLVREAVPGTVRLWDALYQAQGARCAAISVPLTGPIQPAPAAEAPIMVGDLLSAGGGAPWCSHERIAKSLDATLGPFEPDIAAHRQPDVLEILTQCRALSAHRFGVCRWLAEHEELDFMMLVDIATDRIHHAAWRYLDPAHPLYTPHGALFDATHAAYAALDRELGRLVDSLDAGWQLRVVSDHGAQALDGEVYVNRWLERCGLLKRVPGTDTIDWSRTLAWAEGGYYARVYINLRGREPQGLATDFEAVRSQVRDALEALALGENADAWVVAPEELYAETQGQAPDLMAFFGDLRLRANASLTTQRSLIDRDIDALPFADCTHDWYGLLIGAGQPAPEASEARMEDGLNAWL